MVKPISCGVWNINTQYILYTIIFQILYYCLFGLKFGDLFEEVKLVEIVDLFYSDNTQDSFRRHLFIHLIFNHLGILFISLVFLKKEKYNEKSLEVSLRSSSEKEKEKDYRSSHIILIHQNILQIKTEGFFRNYLIIIFLWVCVELFMELYNYTLKDLDFWMLELLIIAYFNAKMFNLATYSHQIFAHIFNAIPCILKIFTIILSFKNNQENIIYVRRKYFVPIGLVLYFTLIILRSYINSKLKWYMDLKYISVRNVLIYYGIIGTIVYTIVCVISTNIPCESDFVKETEKINNINLDMCRVYSYNNINNTYDYYFDSISIYCKNFSFDFSLLIEIGVIISNIIVYFFFKYNFLLVIKYLTPVHVIFSNPLLFFTEKIVLISHNFLITKKFIRFINDDSPNNNLHVVIKFGLDFLGDFFSLIDFLIYLEMIELNCCNLNYNLRKNIMKRAFIETYNDDNSLFSISNDNETTTEEDDLDDDRTDDNGSLIVNTI